MWKRVTVKYKACSGIYNSGQLVCAWAACQLSEEFTVLNRHQKRTVCNFQITEQSKCQHSVSCPYLHLSCQTLWSSSIISLKCSYKKVLYCCCPFHYLILVITHKPPGELWLKWVNYTISGLRVIVLKHGSCCFGEFYARPPDCKCFWVYHTYCDNLKIPILMLFLSCTNWSKDYFPPSFLIILSPYILLWISIKHPCKQKIRIFLRISSTLIAVYPHTVSRVPLFFWDYFRLW